MPNAPHVHNVEEVKANIKRLEHNASGPGSPEGKRSGPPSGIEGGSAGNRNSGTVPNVTSKQKGDDWIGKRSI